MKKLTALILALTMAFSLVGCAKNGGTGQKNDLMSDISAQKVSNPSNTAIDAQVAAEFGVNLAQSCFDDDRNLLISPLSILCALAMTANGAREQTLDQMESAFGLPIEELNRYLRWYTASLPQGENYHLSLANSIWLTEDLRFTPNQDFLQLNADYYGADIYSAPFDASTCNDINSWVKDKTDGMIEEILDEINPYAVMYLVNALAFEAQWSSVYTEYDVSDGIFTKEDGSEREVEMMHSMENVYLEDERAAGFVKYYEDYSYAFVALLPKEGISIEEYLSSLTGAQLCSLLSNARNTQVVTAIPKFETDFSIELSEILVNMGMSDAFDPDNADFTGLGSSTNGNIFINRVLHKTFITVGEQGTKAGAATVVEMPNATGAIVVPDERQEVILDRPFIYLLIDRENALPFFIGTMMDPAR